MLGRLGLTSLPTLEDVFAVEGVDRNLRMTLFIQNASSEDLAEAIARAGDEENWHPALTDQVWIRWTEVDPAAAIASSSNSGQAWWAWAKTDPNAALAAASGNPDLLGKVIRSIGDGDPAWARRLIAEHPEADQPGVWDGILESLTRQDPAAAATLAMERKGNLRGILEDWTNRQPEAALAWIKALPDNPVKRQALHDFASKRCAMDPEAGIPVARELPPGQRRDAILTEAITDLTLKAPEAAMAAAQELPAGGGRQQALGALADKLSAEHPDLALSALVSIQWKELPDPSFKRYEYITVNGSGTGSYSDAGGTDPAYSASGALKKLVRHNAAQTLAALAALPPEREAPVADAVWQWSGAEPEAASTWLRDQPPGEARDRGIDGLVRRLTHRDTADYEAALTWAASATPAGRDKLLRKALNGYAARDLPAATAAAEKLGIQPGPMAIHLPNRPY